MAAEHFAAEREAKRRIQAEILGRLSVLEGDATPDVIAEMVRSSVADVAASLGGMSPETMRGFESMLLDDFLRLGPLEALLNDPQVSEIMVNPGGWSDDGSSKLPPVTYAEVGGKIFSVPQVQFDDDDHLMRIISRIGQEVGRSCNEAHPLMDARLKDGSRVNAVHGSISIDGPSLNIRRFRKDAMTPDQLVDYGTCLPSMMDFLEACVKARLNIIVSGGTGSGKTTLLNVLARFIPDYERIVTVEDTAELHLSQPNLVRLEARPANIEGDGEITIKDLVVNTLRMRPDRIIVGECRSDETIQMLQAMQTGHDGSLTTVHANDPAGVIHRITTMVKNTKDANWDVESVHMQISAAVDLIVQTERSSDGKRRITSITHVGEYSDGTIKRNELFAFKRDSFGDDGAIYGHWESSGMQPLEIKQRIINAGLEYHPEWFVSDGGWS